MDTGYIKLFRKITEWEWFDKSEMVHVFIFLLVKANHKDNEWRGINIKRGQIVTSLQAIKAATSLSIQTIRTCILRLEKSGEINKQTTSKYSIITLCKYDSYNDQDSINNKKPTRTATGWLTNNQQATNKQLTTNKNEENDKNEENIEIRGGGTANFELLADSQPADTPPRDVALELSILKFFGYSEMPQWKNQQVLISDFCRYLESNSLKDHFKSQFESYKKFCALGDNMTYRFQLNNYLGRQEEKWNNGKWNICNWEEKLKNENLKHNSNQQGNNSATVVSLPKSLRKKYGNN